MRPHRTLPGFFLTLLALGCQLALSATVPAAARGLTFLTGYSVICHVDDGTGSGPTPEHKTSDCQLCPLCATLSTPAATLADAGAVPLPATLARPVATPRPPSTAPPATRRTDARPRGPPSLA